MRIKLKEFLKITDFEENGEKIFLKLGFFSEDSYELVIDNKILYLLALLDGEKTLSEIKEKMIVEFPEISDEDIFRTLTVLIDNNIIENLDDIKSGLTTTEKEHHQNNISYYSIFSQQSYKIQNQLKNTRIAILGMNEIGCWISYILANSGFLNFIGIDNSIIEKSDLSGQILFTNIDVGKYKSDVMKTKLKNLNSNIDFVSITKRIHSLQDIEQLFNTDFVIITKDYYSKETYNLIRSFCHKKGIPYSYVGTINYLGYCGPIIIPDKFNQKNFELFSNQEFDNKHVEAINSRYKNPNFVPFNALLASMQSLEIIRFLTGLTKPKTINKRYVFDSFKSDSQLKELLENDKIEIDF